MFRTTAALFFTAVAAQEGCTADEEKSISDCVGTETPALDAICEFIQKGLDCYGKESCFDKAECQKAIDDAADLIGDDCKLKCKCFPATAMVTLEDGSTKAMADLTVGDKVHVGNGEFSEVFYFSTQMAETSSQFVKLTTSDGELLLTAGHYLYVNGVLAPASTAKAGDSLTLANGASAKISAVGTAYAPGLYNPHTMTGDIVVDGFLTSTYTDAVHPTLAHAVLYPLRQLYSAGITSFDSVAKISKKAAASLPSWFMDAVA